MDEFTDLEDLNKMATSKVIVIEVLKCINCT